MEKALDVLAQQDRFFVPEAAQYLNDYGLWLADNRVLSISSLRSLENSGDYLRGMVYGFGVGVDVNTGDPIVFDSTSDYGLAVEVRTGTPYPVFFEPETGRLIIPSIKGVLLESALKKQEALRIALGDNVYAQVRQAPRARIVSLNNTYYVFDSQALRNLPTVTLERDYTVTFGVESLVYKRGTVVTFLEPFAKKKIVGGQELTIPAIVEYGEDLQAEGKFTYLRGQEKQYSSRFPLLTYRDPVQTGFWEEWIAGYDAMIQGMIEFPNNVVEIPTVRIESREMPRDRGFKFVPYEYTLHIGWPGNGSALAFGEQDPLPHEEGVHGNWYKSVSISLGTLCDVQMRLKPDVEFEEGELISGHLKPVRTIPDISPLRDRNAQTIEALFRVIFLLRSS